MSNHSDQKRRHDLESSIDETLSLIREYEEKRRLSDDPRAQRDAERQITDLHQFLEQQRIELAELEHRAEPITSIWPLNIPNEPYYALPGRKHVLGQLLNVLNDPQGPPVIVIDGLGGLGKTAMTIEITRRALNQGLFEGAIGDTAKQEILAGDVIVQMREASLDFDSLVDTLARQLGRWELPTLRAEEKRTALAQILRQQRYLILIDNLETTENAYALVAQVSRLLNPSRALVTSRQQVRHNFVRSFSLQGLDEVDSLFFLRTDAQQRGIPHLAEMPTEQLVPIHEMTGGAPLALKLVIAQAQFLDLSLILQQFRQAGGNLYPFIFRQSWLHLSPTAQRLLIYIGRTVVTTVGWEELNSVGIAANETLLLAAIDQLIAYSLLTVSAGAGQKRYGIHQLTRQFVTSDLPEIWRAQG